MDALGKLKREEARWRFSEQAGLFDRVFSRPILGLLWWWWLFVTFFLSVVLTTRTAEPFRRSFYFAAFLAAVFSVLIGIALSSPEKRSRWLARQQPLAAPPMVRLTLRLIPCVCAAVIIWSIVARW
jgi:hypothetical protein